MQTSVEHAGGLLTEAAPRMGKSRSAVKNLDDPRGQFGAFLRDWVDRKHDGDESRLAKSLGVTARAIRYWMKGEVGPNIGELDRIADAMGYADWFTLTAAVKRFIGK